MSKVRLGVVGYGNMGATHCRSIMREGKVPNMEVTAICDIDPDRLALALSANDVKMIKAAPGIGPKIAQRLILDLKDKVSAYATDNGIEDIAKISAAKDMPNVSEAVAALTMLGYSQADASVAVSQIDPSLSVEDIIRQGLKILSKQ